MPGHNEIVDEITKKQLIRLKPKRVIDVGIGYGSYGKMIKDCYNKCEIIGIEIWKPYIKKFPRLVEYYDDIIIGNIKKLINDTKIYGDLIIFGDVLEHLSHKDAINIVERASKKFKFIIINSPVGFQPQKPVLRNPYEKHRCGLYKEDFLKFDIIEYNEFISDSDKRRHKSKLFSNPFSGYMFNILIKGDLNGN